VMKLSRVMAWIDENSHILYPSMLLMLCAFAEWQWQTSGSILKYLPTRVHWTVPGRVQENLLASSVVLAFVLILYLWAASHSRKWRQLYAISAARDSLDLNSRENCLDVAPIKTARPASAEGMRGEGWWGMTNSRT
jgi:hypothetical protein